MRIWPILLTSALLLPGCSPNGATETGHGDSAEHVGTPSPAPTAAPENREKDVDQHVESLQRKFHLKDLQTATLKANGHDIPCWVMDTADKQEEGMMWLTDKDVKDNQGMIFAFSTVQPEDPKHGFWMHNTVLPLDIVFLTPPKKSDAGSHVVSVINIQEGKPFDETNLPSKGDYQYVLEMKQGTATRLGIRPGTEITIPGNVKGK